MTLFCISADSHVTEPPDTYLPRIDPRFRDRAPRLVYNDQVGDAMLIDEGQSIVPFHLVAAAGLPTEEIRLGNPRRFDDLHRGGWEPEARLLDQDRDGVAAEVIYPSVGMLLCSHPEIDYRKACFDAYNLWLAEFCETSPSRLIGVGQTAMRTPEEGIEDLERIRDLGLRGVMLPAVPGQNDYDHACYEPFWEAAVDIGLPLSFHILTGAGNSPMSDEIRGPKMNGGLAIMRANQDIMGMLILGGVFARHPRLRIVCVEADAGWVPHYMYRMDHIYDRHRNWLTCAPLDRMPSEYFRENIYVTFQDDWIAFRVVDLLNSERLLWANDFPHSDSTWPNSQELLATHTATLTGQDRSRILHGNVSKLYGLDL
jgi:predicted TIM-barrel fold metal-dependent hydrolase